jgi:putative transposase
MQVPGDRYKKSPRPYRGLGDLDYPIHDWTATVTSLDMQVPGDRYKKSPRPYRGLGDLDYPIHDWTATVTSCGRICYKRRKINLSTVFAGQKVGVKQVSDKIWLVSFMQYDLGYFDHETCRLEPIENPFSPKVLPMSPV